MNGLTIAVITVLAVIFIIIALECILRRGITYVLTSTDGIEDNIEAELRILLKKNPGSEIFVVDESQTGETKIILEKLTQDFPEIHIIKAGS